MSSKKGKDPSQPDAAQPTDVEERSRKDREPEPAEAVPAEPEGEQVAAEPTLEQQVERLQNENLRLMAELRNVRQRAQREKTEALKYAEADFARDLLVIIDDIERTLQSARKVENVQALAEGVRIVYDHFLKVLRGREIEPIDAVGKPFDPELYEALMQQPSDEHPAKTVIQELARGYKMHGRVIRPSRVIVSSGPPATPEPGAGDEKPEENDADL